MRERKRARVERGAGDVPGVPENRDDEQMAVRQADASGGDIREKQHEEDDDSEDEESWKTWKS